MYREEYDYPEWARAENMEMSTPLCELWKYPETPQGPRRFRRKIAEALYRMADCVSAGDGGMKGRVKYV